MTLKSDAKFEEKLTLGSENGMRSLVNFNASSGKSLIAYKVSAKKLQRIISHDTEKRSKL